MSEENTQNDQVVEDTQQQQDESQPQSEIVKESEDNCDQSNNEGQSAQLEPEHFRKVFVGGLSYKTDDESFKNYFSKFGELLDLVVMKDKESGKSRGFGFVTYASSSHVDQLMKNRPHNIDGRQVETKRATPKEDSGRQEIQVTVKKLFVGGIRDSINEEDLKSYFGAYGNITDCAIMRDKEKNTSRGFGFITFDDYDPVDKIIIEKHHTINGLALQCQKALPKDANQSQNRANQSRQHHNFTNFSNNDFMQSRNNGFQMNGFNANGMNFGSYSNGYANGNGNRNGRGGNGGGGGPMRGGHSKFNNRPQAPYAGGKNRQVRKGPPRNGPYRMNNNTTPMNNSMNNPNLISSGMNQINMVGNGNGMF